MSEANILNATAGSIYSPDFSDDFELPDLPDVAAATQADSGEVFTRTIGCRGRVIPMKWLNRPTAVADYLRQWAQQYEHGYFSYYDLESARYFTGRFQRPGPGQPILKISRVGNNRVNVSGTFVELPGKPMYAYPSNWDRDAIFIEDRDDDGNALPLFGGAWYSITSGLAHGGKCYASQDVDHTAEWEYVGYGVRIWGLKTDHSGRADVYIDGVFAAFNIDFYAVADTISAPLYTNANLPLGRHRVKLVIINKNPASSADECYADAIEVMR